MVVQPLVRKHASKQNQPIWGLLFVMHPLVRVISKQFSPEKGLLLLCGAERHGSEVDGQVNDVPHGQDDSSRLKQGRHEKRANGAGQIRGRNAGMAIERRITGGNNLLVIILRVDVSKNVRTQMLRNLEEDRCPICMPSRRTTPSTLREGPILSCKRSWQREVRQGPQRPEFRPGEPAGAHRSEAAQTSEAGTGRSWRDDRLWRKQHDRRSHRRG